MKIGQREVEEPTPQNDPRVKAHTLCLYIFYISHHLKSWHGICFCMVLRKKFLPRCLSPIFLSLQVGDELFALAWQWQGCPTPSTACKEGWLATCRCNVLSGGSSPLVGATERDLFPCQKVDSIFISSLLSSTFHSFSAHHRVASRCT